MEDNGGLGGTYDKLVCQEDFDDIDEYSLHSNQENQQASVSILRLGSRIQSRSVAVSLTVLALLLLSTDIGLGVYYRQLRDGHRTISDITSELANLQGVYSAAIQSRDEVRRQLSKELNEQKVTKWELEHQQSRGKEYEKQADKLKVDIAMLSSHVPLITEGCRHCLPGWTFANSQCYYLAFSDALPRRSWQDARTFCKKQGGDLVVTDTREKHLAVHDLINTYHIPIRHTHLTGFWIGLRDVEEEGTWRWLDGSLLTEG
ncbi:CD209 antigen-like isoform X2 [Betta splendens]|nr:CD209 antigen-like isoform X2 [Betta splendens]